MPAKSLIFQNSRWEVGPAIASLLCVIERSREIRSYADLPLDVQNAAVSAGVDFSTARVITYS